MTTLQLLAFGELASETWGVSWMSEASGPARLAVRIGSAAAVAEVKLERPGDGAWHMTGDGLSLIFRPEGAQIASHDPEEQLEREDQLCRVDGTLRVAGEAAEINCLGWRSAVHGASALKRFDSMRFLAAWLGPGAGFSLTAVRPRKARDHEADAVAAAVIEEPPAQVADPRLSTTYAEDGQPARAGLELWLEAKEPESPEGETSLQYPRRAAGEAAGAALDWKEGNLALHALPLRWHSHGQEGPGVYVLGRHR